MKKIGVLASYNGSGFVALQEYLQRNEIDAEIKVVISNNTNANCLQAAQDLGVDSCVINSKVYPNEDVDQKIIKKLQEYGCELVLLSGYMKKLGDELVDSFTIVNTHPALLPKFGGKGMYGSFVHEAVIEAKEKESGVTVHYVNNEYDKGEIILQKSLSISEEDDAKSLEDRIKKLEKEAIIEAFTKLLK